jgi:hypothetical protein
MDPIAATELSVAATAAAAVTRLTYLNLARRFPALVAYLVFLAVESVAYGLLSPTSAAYFWGYIVLQPLEYVFSILAVRELFALVFDDYPGIRSVGRWVTYAGVGLALSISLLLTGLFWNGGTRGRSIHFIHLFYFEVSQRSTVFTLAFLIVTILLFLSKYPLRLSRNTLVSSVFFSVLFLSEAAGLLADTLAPKLYNVYADSAELAFVSICLVGWAALLKPEPAVAPARVKFSTPQEDHLLQQLNSLNQLMARAARR